MDEAKRNEAVESFRSVMEGVPDFKGRSEPDLVCDDRLERFLKGRNYDPDKARLMFENHLTWRKANNIESLRAQVVDKEFKTSVFPHAAELRAAGMGMLHMIVDAGFDRIGDIVYIEQLGGTGHLQVPPGKNDEYLQMLLEHYYGFFEKRSLVLEDLSIKTKRMVRCFQIRDVSKLSLVPQGGIMGVVRKILKAGLDNYPESASTVVFTNPPTIFSAIFALIKPWLPDDTRKKMLFLSGDDVVPGLLKHVRPKAIEAWFRIVDGEYGDDVSDDLATPKSAWTREYERVVGARHADQLIFALSSTTGTGTVSWTRKDEGEATKSSVWGRLYYSVEKGSAGDIFVESKDIKDINSASLPNGVSEGVVVIYLDHTHSWMMSHKFRVLVEGK